jgi:hypothetical protein
MTPNQALQPTPRAKSVLGRSSPCAARLLDFGEASMSEQHSESWPTGWEGNSVIDCGDAGRLCSTISVEGDPSSIHRRNYEEMLRRWPQLWPEIEEIVSCMVDPENPLQDLRKVGAAILIHIPSALISDGVCWSVGVKFYHDKSIWDVPIHGWTPTSDGAQPHF